jgi:hypothetical protein
MVEMVETFILLAEDVMTFKFSTQTITIMKHFNHIHPTMLFREGSELRSHNTTNLMGIAQIEETIPKEFRIYDLAKFMGILSAFGDPIIKFNDTYLTISNSNEKKYDYRFANPNTVHEPPEGEVDQNDPLEPFNLTKKDLQELIKIISISGHPEAVFVGEQGKLSIQSFNPKDATVDTYENIIGTTDKTFRVRIKHKDLVLLMPEDYTVTLAENGCLFDAPSAKLKYYIAPEAD